MPDTLTFTSVHNILGAHASASFTSKTSEVFKEEHNIAPIIINEDTSRIVRIVRKQACYVRFAPADKSGVIPYILYVNWRNTVCPEDIERIELLNPKSPFIDLQNRGKKIKFHSTNPKTMAMLINDNDTLKKYVPNTLKAVAGELSLFDKIQYHLLQAEQWLTDTFVSSDTMSRIRTYSDNTPLLHYCRIITAAEAMLHAVLQLDLILTPNGFGIVSNQNVIPASKERIERLLLSLEKQRDDALAVILTMLPDAHHWTASEQFNYFAATMFPTLDIVHQLGFADHIWLRYQDTRAKLLAIEHRLETEFFSPELMDMLRTANALNRWDMTLDTAQYKRMYQRISAIEFSILRIGEYPIPSIIDIVNSIRLAKGNVFAEWKQSDTAKLFEDHGYKNKKESGGYFF